jgi:hypothetical protein
LTARTPAHTLEQQRQRAGQATQPHCPALTGNEVRLMRNSPIGATNGPWRLLILDRDDPSDARWLIVTVAGPADVRPADATGDEPTDLVRAWASARHGSHVTLTKLPHARCWRIDGPAHR